ncbi:DUF1428 domain-containing protein [Emcibacter sp.]|uniref:DUF1428 domain-containing protein n=1 Tax=Emcibacter sp. TaxID=1979954 RepID=UPI003A903E35
MYIDGFVLAVPTKNREAYLALAEKCLPVFKEFGALRVVETWGVDVPEGKVTSFPMAVKCAKDETVVFSWVEWPSKQARDKGVAQCMEKLDRMLSGDNMPYDGKRMIVGGFEAILEG